MSTDQFVEPGRSRRDRALAFRALGDPTRLEIVELLAVQDLSPHALAEVLGIPGNLLAHHLKVLEAAGLVERSHSQHDGRRTYVTLVGGALVGLLPSQPEIDVDRVVFVCTHNSARSVLAEALWRSESPVPCASAGTDPASRVNPRAQRAARQAGLPAVTGTPRHIDEVLRRGDLVVSVCDAVNEELEGLDGPRIHWSVPDPSRVGTDRAFSLAVDNLRARVRHLAPRVRQQRPTHRKARS